LCGQSTGGAIVIDHVLNAGASSPAQGQVILLAPLVRPRAWGWSKFSYYLLKPFVKGIARRFSENSNDPEFLPFLQADPCSHCVCRRLGWARWRAGSNASKPHRRAPGDH
jgi:alpha-beta hydrolase superfamily lysophospholipase